MAIGAILSDLDGTLVDSTDAVLRVWHGWMDDRGLRRTPPEEHPHGIPAREVVARLAPQLDADRRPPSSSGARSPTSTASSRCRVPRRCCDAPARRPPVAVVTSCTLPLARARLRAAGLPQPPAIVTAERTARVKPHPDPYLLGAELLGVAPAACVVLEDAPAGIAAGRAAGMRVVAVRGRHVDERRLREADEIVDDVAAFLARLP
ncbi:HAD-IA family hydrolase [Patulibacter brassicae]|uniref:HAD-IA family hydrolase n=1 Tax=Patulibacter brassicae TaxID=1705717 RepID=A0ABU4VNV3_9ACTN|nr:HAD-IA family hydrolase [Patulibacter brassicae]MDX8153017.1 HAD-IA family hydrolase [Patulibacter brassicae]